jgi:hypothetical protein
MNQGFFGFPSISDSNIIDQKEFDISGSYYIPSTAKSLIIFAVGGGGGGGGGVRLSGNGCAGGNGGNSGHVVITQIDKKSLNGITHLNIVIGAGGTGGAGSPSNGATASPGTGGGATSVGIPGKKAPFIVAAGNQFGIVGSTSFPNSQAPSGASIGISILFGTVTTPDPVSYVGSGSNFPNFPDVNSTLGIRGARGTTETTGGSIHVLNPLTCGGAGGGGVTHGSPAGTARSGGNVKIFDANSVMQITSASLNYLPVFSSITSGDYAPNDTVYAGGSVNTATPPINSNQLICPECMYSIGFGGAGGGGGASTSANNGANGYRGGGGGGGGGAKNVTAGNGGKGGNGYVKIIAIG